MGTEKPEITINWYHHIHDMIMSAYKTAVSFAHNFHTKIVEEKRKLPYNINIIDELHINENAHSRILCKLLLYGQDAGT